MLLYLQYNICIIVNNSTNNPEIQHGIFFLSSKIILNFFYFDIIDSDLQMFNIYNESHMSKCFHFI